MQRHFFRLLTLLLLLSLLLCSCSPGNQPSEAPSDTENSGTEGEQTNPPLPPEKNYEDGTYTLMIYMCGSNLESRSGSATKNIAEMLSAEMPENTKVIIQTGGAKKWRNYDITAAVACRYTVIAPFLCAARLNDDLGVFGHFCRQHLGNVFSSRSRPTFEVTAAHIDHQGVRAVLVILFGRQGGIFSVTGRFRSTGITCAAIGCATTITRWNIMRTGTHQQ